MIESSAKAPESVSEKPGISLDDSGIRKRVAERIEQDLDAHCIKIYDEGFRNHLGASAIGDECRRKLWYMFRWVGKSTESGRVYRLFNRGHREETRHFEWLRGMGFQVWTHNENEIKEDGSFAQFRIKNQCKGHFGGSLDAIAKFPASYNIDEPILVSCKTNGTGAGFNKVKNEALVIAKPEHYTQESIYGLDYGISYVLYLNANKNDDDIAIKVEKLDFALAERMIVKAESIIFSQTPPPRLSENPIAYQCKNLCQFKDICHYKKPPMKNCRSCVKCTPIENKQFYCNQWNAIIPGPAELLSGCDEWSSITAE